MPSLYSYPDLLNNPKNLDVKGSSTQKFEPLAQHPDPPGLFKLLDSNYLAYGTNVKSNSSFIFLLLYFSLTNKLSFETLIIKIGPQLLLPDPKNPPKNPKGAWEISG